MNINEILNTTENVTAFRISVKDRNFLGILGKINNLKEFLELNVISYEINRDNFDESNILDAVVETSDDIKEKYNCSLFNYCINANLIE